MLLACHSFLSALCLPAEALEKATEERAGLIASRTGDVLGPHTILKEDHFPGCQSAKLPNIIPGAPNFRGVPGQNVYGSALPTVEGIKAVLTHVGAGASTHNRRQVRLHVSRIGQDACPIWIVPSPACCVLGVVLCSQGHQGNLIHVSAGQSTHNRCQVRPQVSLDQSHVLHFVYWM